MADILRDFETQVREIHLLTFTDGRFNVILDGEAIFRSDIGPEYEQDILPHLQARTGKET